MTNNITEYLKTIFKELAPEVDLTENTPAYDLFINFPAQTYLQDIIKKYNNFTNNISLSNFDLDEFTYDNLLSNWFFERKPETFTKVTLRLYFLSPQTLSILSTSNFLIGTDIFRVEDTLIIDTSVYNVLVLENNTYHYIDVDVQAIDSNVQVSTSNILVTVPFKNTAFVKAEIIEIKSIGSPKETNAEAFSRLQKELGLRGTISIRSLSNYLNFNFPGVVLDSYVAGFDALEQKRDIISLEVPKYYAYIYFKNKVNLNIPISTEFKYNNTNIIYKPKNNTIIGIDSNLWKSFGSLFYVEVPLNLDNLYNPQGFQNDKDLICDYLQNTYPSDYFASISKMSVSSIATFKVGGHTDVYLKTPIEKRIYRLTVPTDSNGIIDIPSVYKPVLKINKITKLDNVSEEVDVFNLLIDNETFRYSTRDQSNIFIDPGTLGVDVEIELLCCPFITTIQNSIDDSPINVVSEDILFRSFIPIFLEISLLVYGVPELEPQIQQAIETYIRDLPAGSDLIISALATYVQQNVPDLNGIYIESMSVIATQHNPDGEELLLEFEDIIKPIENFSKRLTRNLYMFVIDTITVDFI